MMMRNVQPREGYGWDQFCADPAAFADQCLADAGCSRFAAALGGGTCGPRCGAAPL